MRRCSGLLMGLMGRTSKTAPGEMVRIPGATPDVLFTRVERASESDRERERERERESQRPMIS